MKSALALGLILLGHGALVLDLQAAALLFDMRVAPELSDPVWTADGSTGLGSLTDGILRIQDEGFGFLQYRFFLPGTHRTIEARLRMHSSDPNGSFGCAYLGFLARYPFVGTYAYMETNRLCLWDDCHGSLQTTNIDLSHEFHVVRLTQDSTVTRVFVDGSELLALASCEQDTEVSFGAASIPARGDSSWDYVALTDLGTFAPQDFSFVEPQLTVAREGPALMLCWNSVAPLVYQLESSSNLTDAHWTDRGDPAAGNGVTNCLSERIAPGSGSRFYRLRVQP